MTTQILDSSDLIGGKLGIMVNKDQGWTKGEMEHMGRINQEDKGEKESRWRSSRGSDDHKDTVIRTSWSPDHI